MKNKSMIVMTISYLVSIIQSLYYFPRLPQNVAVHFGGTGVANNWSNRQFLIIFDMAIITVLFAMFIAITLLIKNIPSEMINLPDKNYWLSGEKREKTLATIQNILSEFGSATIILLLIIFEIVYRTNVKNLDVLLINPFIPLAFYVLYVLIFAYRVLKIFKKK